GDDPASRASLRIISRRGTCIVDSLRHDYRVAFARQAVRSRRCRSAARGDDRSVRTACFGAASPETCTVAATVKLELSWCSRHSGQHAVSLDRSLSAMAIHLAPRPWNGFTAALFNPAISYLTSVRMSAIASPRSGGWAPGLWPPNRNQRPPKCSGCSTGVVE